MSELFLGALEREQVWSIVVRVITGLYLGTPPSALQKAELIQSMPQEHTIPPAAQAHLYGGFPQGIVSCKLVYLHLPGSELLKTP